MIVTKYHFYSSIKIQLSDSDFDTLCLFHYLDITNFHDKDDERVDDHQEENLAFFSTNTIQACLHDI